MAINIIPKKDVFINEIINTFVINFSMLKMCQIGLIDKDSKLNMVDVDRNIKLTAKGKEVGDLLLKDDGERPSVQQ